MKGFVAKCRRYKQRMCGFENVVSMGHNWTDWLLRISFITQKNDTFHQQSAQGYLNASIFMINVEKICIYDSKTCLRGFLRKNWLFNASRGY